MCVALLASQGGRNIVTYRCRNLKPLKMCSDTILQSGSLSPRCVSSKCLQMSLGVWGQSCLLCPALLSSRGCPLYVPLCPLLSSVMMLWFYLWPVLSLHDLSLILTLLLAL